MVLASSPESGRILSMGMSRFSGYSSGASTTGQRSWGKSAKQQTPKAVISRIFKVMLCSSALSRVCPQYLDKVSWGRRQSALVPPQWLPSDQTVDGRAAGATPLWQCPGSHLPDFLRDRRQRTIAGGLEAFAWWTGQLRGKIKNKLIQVVRWRAVILAAAGMCHGGQLRPNNYNNVQARRFSLKRWLYSAWGQVWFTWFKPGSNACSDPFFPARVCTNMQKLKE